MVEGFARSYRDVRIRMAPEPIALTGATGTLSTWSYTHDVGNENERLIVRTVVVFRGERVHTFHLVDSLGSPRISRDVWARFLRSIRYSVPSAPERLVSN